MRQKKSHSIGLSFNRLDERVMPAASVQLLPSGILEVQGDPNTPDRLVVSTFATTAQGILGPVGYRVHITEQATPNANARDEFVAGLINERKVSMLFETTQSITGVRFVGGGSNLNDDDWFRNDTNIPATMNGGAGVDMLVGGTNNDLFLGSDGRRQLLGLLSDTRTVSPLGVTMDYMYGRTGTDVFNRNGFDGLLLDRNGGDKTVGILSRRLSVNELNATGDFSVALADGVLSLAGPTGAGFQMRGNWQAERTADGGMRYFVGTGVVLQTLEIGSGFQDVTINSTELSPIEVITEPTVNPASGVFREAHIFRIPDPVQLPDAVPVPAFEEVFSEYLDLVKDKVGLEFDLPSATWTLALGSEIDSDIPLSNAVPYFFASQSDAITLKFGEIELGTEITQRGQDLSVAFGPNDPFVGIQIGGVGVNDFDLTLAYSADGNIVYTPDQPVTLGNSSPLGVGLGIQSASTGTGPIGGTATLDAPTTATMKSMKNTLLWAVYNRARASGNMAEYCQAYAAAQSLATSPRSALDLKAMHTQYGVPLSTSNSNWLTTVGNQQAVTTSAASGAAKTLTPTAQQFSGNFFLRAADVQLGSYPLFVTGGVTIDFDANNDGNAAILDLAGLGQSLLGQAGGFQIDPTALLDLQIGVNGSISFGQDFLDERLGLAMELGQGSAYWIPRLNTTGNIGGFGFRLATSDPFADTFMRRVDIGSASLQGYVLTNGDWGMEATANSMRIGNYRLGSTTFRASNELGGVSWNSRMNAPFSMGTITVNGSINYNGNFSITSSASSRKYFTVLGINTSMNFQADFNLNGRIGSSANLSTTLRGSLRAGKLYGSLSASLNVGASSSGSFNISGSGTLTGGVDGLGSLSASVRLYNSSLTVDLPSWVNPVGEEDFTIRW